MSFKDMFAADPTELDQDTRELLARLLSETAELHAVEAAMCRLRARQFLGEDVADAIAIKDQQVVKIREDVNDLRTVVMKKTVDVKKLLGLLPMVIGGVVQSFNIPPQVVAEVMGMDVGMAKRVFGELKALVTDGFDDDFLNGMNDK